MRARGQALAEFALLFPLLLIAILATLDIARVSAAYAGMVAATERAAIYVATTPGGEGRVHAEFMAEGVAGIYAVAVVTDTERLTVTARTDFPLLFVPAAVPLRTRLVWPQIPDPERVKLIE